MATQELNDQAAQLSPIQPMPHRPTWQKPVSKVKSNHLHADGGWPFRGRFRVACLLRKTCHFSGGGTNLIGDPERWSQSHTSSGTDAFLGWDWWDFSPNLAPRLQPTHFKTHDCSTEILLSLLPCTMKYNYTRL